MAVDIFGFAKDERVDKEWHFLVDKLEDAGWERESFTTLYEQGNLFIPDAPEMEMSYETKHLLFNITALLSEKRIYLSIAPTDNTGLKGQISLITHYGSNLDLWLDSVISLPKEVTLKNFSEPLMPLIHLFPDSYLDMPVDDERVALPAKDPIAIKILQTPWCKKGPCHEIALSEHELSTLKNMAKMPTPWI